MRIMPELVIYDGASDREAIELAREAALKVWWKPEIFVEPQPAAEAIGFFTLAVITAVDRRHRHYYGGLSPLDVSDTLEIPRAVLVDKDMYAEEYLRPDFPDIALPRSESTRIVPLVSCWLETLRQST